MEVGLSSLIQLVVGVATIVAAYMVIKARLFNAEKKVDKLERGLNAFHGHSTNPGAEPVYITRRECKANMEGIKEEVTEVKESVAELAKHNEQSRRYMAHQLAAGGKTMKEVKEILNGGQ